MTSRRLLFLGLHGSALEERALTEASLSATDLVIAPTPLSREQTRPRPGPRVWCWTDLWAAVRASSRVGPRVLSEAGSRAVFLEAIRRARATGRLKAIERVLEWPGFRRRLRAQIKRWTLHPPLAVVRPARETPIETAQRAVFEEYARLLESIGAVDQAGLEDWASTRLQSKAEGLLKSVEHLVVLNWETAPKRSAERFLLGAKGHTGSIVVTLAADASPGSEWLYEHDLGPKVRGFFSKLGFEERLCEPAAARPKGLVELERALFREEGAPGSVATSEGLVIWGLAQGDETARGVAHEVRRALDEGVEPESVLVLSRSWSEQADLTAEVLAEWGVPVHATNPRPLSEDHAVAALRIAMELPLGWEAEQLARLLRHGRVRPDWLSEGSLDLAEAAWAVDRTGVFRGRDAILGGIERPRGRSPEHRAGRTIRALATTRRFLDLFQNVDRVRTWRDQARELERIARNLGLDQGDRRGLELLYDALADHVETLETLGRGAEPVPWTDFVRAIESLASETLTPDRPAPPGCVRMATLDQARGGRGAVVIVFDLAEGAFPTREAAAEYAKTPPGGVAAARGAARIARDMADFLGLFGRADSRLVLIHPTRDSKGRDALRAGFLDDVSRRLAADALAQCQGSPAALGETAGTPRDERLQAVRSAFQPGGLDDLSSLAANPSHRPALLGSAVGIHLMNKRRRGADFAEFEGRLGDEVVLTSLAERFGTDHAYSPSQLETYIACPFRFFCRFVLNIETPAEPDEFEDDFALRGRALHKLLEQYEQDFKDQPKPDESGRRLLVDANLRRDRAGFSSPGVEEIERRRLFEAFDHYLDQAEAYRAGGNSYVHSSELCFGGGDADFLEIGPPSDSIKIQGMIDRIDVVDQAGAAGFRVIDYKTGKVPTGPELKQGRSLQVFLYAWAVEQANLAGAAATPIDMGYWELQGRGYRKVKTEDWDELKNRLADYVTALVESIRTGFFAPVPIETGCERRCDYRGVCRIGEIRGLNKRRDPIPAPELPVEMVKAAARPKGGKSS